MLEIMTSYLGIGLSLLLDGSTCTTMLVSSPAKMAVGEDPISFEWSFILVDELESGSLEFPAGCSKMDQLAAPMRMDGARLPQLTPRFPSLPGYITHGFEHPLW